MQHHLVIPARLLFAAVLLASLIALFLNFQRQKRCTNCVVLIGDSITSMWPNLSGTQFSGLQIVNRGLPGDTTSHMLSRFDHDVVQLRPRVVVILGGINDIAQIPLPAVEQNLASLAEAAEHHGIYVVLATLPPTGEPHPDKSSAAHIPDHDGLIAGHDKIQTLNDWLKNFANQKHYTIADYHSALTDDCGYYQKGLTTDGIHPSLQGYGRMEPILREAMQSVLHNHN